MGMVGGLIAAKGSDLICAGIFLGVNVAVLCASALVVH